MTIDNQTGLVLEGGGMRGVFTCGVLDYLMDHDIRFPYTIGVSAGAGRQLGAGAALPGGGCGHLGRHRQLDAGIRGDLCGHGH